MKGEALSKVVMQLNHLINCPVAEGQDNQLMTATKWQKSLRWPARFKHSPTILVELRQPCIWLPLVHT